MTCNPWHPTATLCPICLTNHYPPCGKLVKGEKKSYKCNFCLDTGVVFDTLKPINEQKPKKCLMCMARKFLYQKLS
jgi:hypothetical protein